MPCPTPVDGRVTDAKLTLISFTVGAGSRGRPAGHHPDGQGRDRAEYERETSALPGSHIAVTPIAGPSCAGRIPAPLLLHVRQVGDRSDLMKPPAGPTGSASNRFDARSYARRPASDKSLREPGLSSPVSA